MKFKIQNKTVINCFIAGFLLVQLPFVQAQKGFLTGKVVDSQTNVPLSYASVRVMKSSDSTLIGGNISGENGLFSIEIPFGQANAVVEFIGYQALKMGTFNLTKDHSTHDLGVVKLVSTAKNLDEVVVQAEKSTMELSLDKKIFNVGKDLGNAGGSATDILSNIPSVSVDVEGNVKLRGSDNVRILIDGKPSGLTSFKGGSGLQQLQGSLIEKVEIITNPSARYEAEGMSGIINIVLKKQQKQGLNGSFEVTTGFPMNYGLAANLNYRHKKVNFFVNYGLNYRRQPAGGSQYQEVYNHDTTLISQIDRVSNVTGFHNNVKAGLDYFFNPKSSLTAFYVLHRTDVRRITDFVYKDYLNTKSNLKTVTMRQQDEKEHEPHSELGVTYKKSFQKKGHELIGNFHFLDYWERSDQVYTQSSTFADGSPNPSNNKLQTALNDEFEKHYLFQLDYVHPFGKEGKFETGLRSGFRHMINDYIAKEKGVNGVFFTLPGLDNYFTYDENIHAAYAILGNKEGKISYQLGLRGELTDTKTTLQKTNESHPRNYGNLFPSAHLTYKLPKENALQLSYSRRVRRPTYDELSPFVTYSDNRNYFSGNPALNPEFSHAFEMGHIKYFEKGSLSSSLYYRHISDKIQSIRRVDNVGVSKSFPQNLLYEDAFGAEFTSQVTPVKWWKTDNSFNFFRAITEGSNIGNTIASDTYSWFIRHTSKFSLPQSIDFQVRGSYEAPQKTPQGIRKAMYYVDLGVNKDILKGTGTVTLNVSDLFNTRRSRTITEGVNFYTSGDYQRNRRQINLVFSYRLNQAKQSGKKSEE